MNKTQTLTHYQDLYDRFVGSVSPEYYVHSFNGDIVEAVDSILSVLRLTGETFPDNLRESLIEYFKLELYEDSDLSD